MALEKSPREILLGHELIHANHAQKGVWKGDDKTRYSFKIKGQVNRGTAIKEEIQTVGLESSDHTFKRIPHDVHEKIVVEPDNITENNLRKLLKYNQRVDY